MQEARPWITEELGISPGDLAGLHRRFEVVPGAQAQVDWGDEGQILAHVGIPKVYSFHMTLSCSRDPFLLRTSDVSAPQTVFREPVVTLALILATTALVLVIAVLTAAGAAKLARLDGATYPAALTRAAVAFTTVVTLAAADAAGGATDDR